MTCNGWSYMWLGFAQNRWIKMLSLSFYISTPQCGLFYTLWKVITEEEPLNPIVICVAFRWCIISNICVWLEVETGRKKVLKCAGWKSALAFFASFSFALCLSQCVWVRENKREREKERDVEWKKRSEVSCRSYFPFHLCSSHTVHLRFCKQSGNTEMP